MLINRNNFLIHIATLVLFLLLVIVNLIIDAPDASIMQQNANTKPNTKPACL
jgi:hypothetical protein